MAEVTKDRIFEIVMAIEAQVTRLAGGQQDLKGHIGSLLEQARALVASLGAARTDLGRIDLSLGRLDQRLHRIEKRLELADHPAE